MPEGLLEDVLVCGKHNCPMIRVGGDYVCLLEHIDAHLGGKQVTGVVAGPLPGNPKALLRFSDGHTLPLLCPCCGEPLQVVGEAADTFRRGVQGRYLVALDYLAPEGENPGSVNFVFARSLDVDANAAADKDLENVNLHLDSARQIGRPGGVRQRRAGARRRRR